MGKGYRQGRLGVEIKKTISSMLLRELKDPRLSGMISITDVDVTRDGSYATCYVTVLDLSQDPDQAKAREEEVLEGLKSSAPVIRGEIGKGLKLRRVPELIFKIDRSMEYGTHIDEMLKKLDLD